jgi:hypothetical protein
VIVDREAVYEGPIFTLRLSTHLDVPMTEAGGAWLHSVARIIGEQAETQMRASMSGGLAMRSRCGPCYRKSHGADCDKHGTFCHRCGSAEELT